MRILLNSWLLIQHKLYQLFWWYSIKLLDLCETFNHTQQSRQKRGFIVMSMRVIQRRPSTVISASVAQLLVCSPSNGMLFIVQCITISIPLRTMWVSLVQDKSYMSVTDNSSFATGVWGSSPLFFLMCSCTKVWFVQDPLKNWMTDLVLVSLSLTILSSLQKKKKRTVVCNRLVLSCN